MSTDALPQPDPALLPDDVAVLKQLVMQLLEELRLRDERLERQEHHMHLLLKSRQSASAAARRVAGCQSQKPRQARPRPNSREDRA
jgi:REP element-mobilizing transposase RayT